MEAPFATNLRGEIPWPIPLTEAHPRGCSKSTGTSSFANGGDTCEGAFMPRDAAQEIAAELRSEIRIPR